MQGKLLERESDSFGILYTGYLLSPVKIKKVIERERGKREREKERKRERGKRVKWNKQIKLGCFR